MLVTRCQPPYASAVVSRMAWNSLLRYSPETSTPVPMYLSRNGRSSSLSKSAIDGAVTTAPPEMSCRCRTIRLKFAAPWYFVTLVNRSSG